MRPSDTRCPGLRTFFFMFTGSPEGVGASRERPGLAPVVGHQVAGFGDGTGFVKLKLGQDHADL